MSLLPGVTLLRLRVTGSYLQSSSDTQIPASFHREGRVKPQCLHDIGPHSPILLILKVWSQKQGREKYDTVESLRAELGCSVFSFPSLILLPSKR